MSYKDRRILSRDGNKTEYFHYFDDGTWGIETEVDVTKQVEANKFQQSEAPMRYQGEAMNKVASIDEIAVFKWCKQRGISKQEFYGNPEIIKRFLNDPDNFVWRTDRTHKKI